ncbi:MAG: polysaccharide deacetylase family protein [Clostridia bacterium]|nr:polysaccharide deacetylase family protein [Clostridia bacterium]
MKTNKLSLIIIIISLVSFVLTVNAQSLEGATAWFFKKTTDHTQPKLDSRLSFIEKYNCAYVDKSKNSDSDKVIYLTFDAGYENGNVKRILDTMKDEGVSGSFFILENLIKRNPDLVKRMAEEGHLVCNHTAKHKDMSRVTDKDTLLSELGKLEEQFKQLTGCDMTKIYRPPEGRFSEINLLHLTEAGYKTVFWSFAYADWDNKQQPNEKEAMDKIIAGLHNGEILLLHPTSETNANIMKELIRRCKAEGYRFETLDKLP